MGGDTLHNAGAVKTCDTRMISYRDGTVLTSPELACVGLTIENG